MDNTLTISTIAVNATTHIDGLNFANGLDFFGGSSKYSVMLMTRSASKAV